MPRNQAERGHEPIIVLEMARVSQKGECSLTNSVISDPKMLKDRRDLRQGVGLAAGVFRAFRARKGGAAAACQHPARGQATLLPWYFQRSRVFKKQLFLFSFFLSF